MVGGGGSGGGGGDTRWQFLIAGVDWCFHAHRKSSSSSISRSIKCVHPFSFPAGIRTG